MQRVSPYLVGGTLPLLAASLALAQPAGIEPAPAFPAAELVALPIDGWITNGGNILNQRYSPLTQIDRDKVAGLKAVWQTGMGTGAAQNNSGQAQILAHEGVLYVINGVNDVFALAVETGEVLWTHRETFQGLVAERPSPLTGRSGEAAAIASIQEILVDAEAA